MTKISIITNTWLLNDHQLDTLKVLLATSPGAKLWLEGTSPADKQIMEECKKVDFPVKTFEQEFPNMKYPTRMHELALDCDMVVAFPKRARDVMQNGHQTWAWIRKAQKAGKKVSVVYPYADKAEGPSAAS
jgi:hypothetical protein